LVGRDDITEAADAAFLAAYPDAPLPMIHAAVYHVFTDGVGAALKWVAAAERFLRDPNEGFDYGATSHVVYHLYNWLQFQALLPIGREGILERLSGVKLFMSEGSADAAVRVIEQLGNLSRGDARPPDLG
jgi:hypothetical protein